MTEAKEREGVCNGVDRMEREDGEDEDGRREMQRLHKKERDKRKKGTRLRRHSLLEFFLKVLWRLTLTASDILAGSSSNLSTDCLIFFPDTDKITKGNL